MTPVGPPVVKGGALVLLLAMQLNQPPRRQRGTCQTEEVQPVPLRKLRGGGESSDTPGQRLTRERLCNGTRNTRFPGWLHIVACQFCDCSKHHSQCVCDIFRFILGLQLNHEFFATIPSVCLNTYAGRFSRVLFGRTRPLLHQTRYPPCIDAFCWSMTVFPGTAV